MSQGKHHHWGLGETKLPVWIALCTVILCLGLVNLNLSLFQASPVTSPADTSGSQVLGMSNSVNYNAPHIYISSDKYGANGGLIALSSTEEPNVVVSSYQIQGEATVKTFIADQNLMMSYLTVDDKGMQIHTPVDTTNLSLVGQTTATIAGSGPETSVLLPLEGTGIWLVDVTAGNSHAQAFVVRSHTGVVAKEGDNQFIFWGQDYQTQRSITTGQVKLYNLQNQSQEIGTAAFNGQGIATAPINQLADVALVERDGDLAIVPLNLKYLNSSYNYQAYAPKTRQIKYFVFTDRPLYRPGDTIYFKAVLRDDDDARYTVSGGSAHVEITTGYGEGKVVVLSQDYPLNSFGTLNGSAKLPDTAKTDYYSVSVTVPQTSASNSYNFGGYAAFQVENYRKPDYFLSVDSPQTEYISGNNLNFNVSGTYFLGEPLASVPVNYTLWAADYYTYTYYQDQSVSAQSGFNYGFWGGSQITQGQVTLDAQGRAVITLPAKITDGKNKVYSLEVKAVDATGNGSEDVKNVLVYAGTFDIYQDGYNYGTPVGQPASLSLIVVNHKQAPVARQTLTIDPTYKWWEQMPLSPGEKYHRYTEHTETLPSTNIVTDSSGKATYTFNPAKAGSYELKVTGLDPQDNPVIQQFYLWVSPAGTPVFSGNEIQDRLSLGLDKKSYKPGETAKLTLNSSIPDRDIFLSLERARVNRYQIVSLTGNTGIVDLPIEGTDKPNIYVGVSSFSPTWLDSNQTNLVVDTQSQHLKIKISPDAQTYGPGETVTVDLLSTDTAGNPKSSEIAFWAVDKAIFELVDRNYLDIFDTFWHERFNDTQTDHSLEGITALMAEGGGCFAAGTPVTLADGSTKPIEAVGVGDSVLTQADLAGAKPAAGQVTAIHQAWEDGYLDINGQLRVTPDHLLFINGLWQEAGSIKIGDVLTDRNHQPVPVTSLAWFRSRVKVYNLTVNPFYTYFAAGVLVHNQKGDGGRTVFKDTAYWNPNVVTDSTGKATLRFKLPDNLTTWTLSAVGATPDTIVGDAKQDIVVTKSLVVRPVIPNVLQVGDTIMLSALVHNFSQNDDKFDVSLAFDAGDVETATRAAVPIAAKGSQQLYWTVKPLQVKAESTLRFTARSISDPKKSDIVSQKLPVNPYGFHETNGQTGLGSHTFNLSLAADADPAKSTITLNLSPTLVGTLPQAMIYLLQYPYGCVEQTTSRFAPAVISLENPTIYAESLKDKDLKTILKQSVDRLTSLQHADGGWGWWAEDGSSPFITAYVSEFLVRAQKAGVTVNPDLLAKAKQFYATSSYLSPGSKDRNMFIKDDLVAKEYALLFLDPAQKPEKITDFTNISVDLLPWALQVNLKAGLSNPSQNGTAYLLSQAKTEGNTLYWPSGPNTRFGAIDATTGMALRALISAGLATSDRQTLSQVVQYLTNSRHLEYWSNTFATVQVVDALTQYGKTGNEINPEFSYQVTLNQKTLSTGTVTKASQKIPPVVIDPQTLVKQPGTLVVSQTGEGQLYSTLTEDTFHTDPKAPAVSHTMKLSREYVSDRGEAYTLGVGDTVTINLTLSGLTPGDKYAVIADQLPSGMVPVNPGFKNEGSSHNPFWDSGVSGYDLTPNGIVISVSNLSQASQTYHYKARVINAGTFAVPPATASLMYNPEINARTAAETVTIGKEAVIDPMKAVKQNLKAKTLIALNRSSALLIFGTTVFIGLLVTLIVVWRRRTHSSPPEPQPPVSPPAPPVPPVVPPPPVNIS